jgi:MbtH protein
MIESDEELFYVVYNHEEQYSIWPAVKDLPLGWITHGAPMSKEACLDLIEEIWTDITPKSVRDALAANERGSA